MLAAITTHKLNQANVPTTNNQPPRPLQRKPESIRRARNHWPPLNKESPVTRNHYSLTTDVTLTKHPIQQQQILLGNIHQVDRRVVTPPLVDRLNNPSSDSNHFSNPDNNLQPTEAPPLCLLRNCLPDQPAIFSPIRPLPHSPEPVSMFPSNRTFSIEPLPHSPEPASIDFPIEPLRHHSKPASPSLLCGIFSLHI